MIKKFERKISTTQSNYKFNLERKYITQQCSYILISQKIKDLRVMKGNGYGWHISNLKVYGEPKELSEFYRPCSYKGICYSCNRFRPNGTPNDKPNDFCDGAITRPPQSYMFVKEVDQ